MKVIKKGREQKGWAEEFTCTGKGNDDGGCGAVLLVEEDDIFITHSSARDESIYYATFECPDCGVKTDPPKDKIPSEVFRKAKGQYDNPVVDTL